MPTPTELTRLMELGGKPNVLSGRYSRIRIQELRAAGFMIHTWMGKGDKWHYPESCPVNHVDCRDEFKRRVPVDG